ncbi:MAG TPA: IS110 family transposase [Firmicutes bacterium]|nr:IS110 family transposase [Bacillota bacterium]
MTTIPGISTVLVARIIAKIGDIFCFRNHAALAQYARITWARYQSGNFEAEEHSMTKIGNKYLRYYLVVASNSLKVHNEEYKQF